LLAIAVSTIVLAGYLWNGSGAWVIAGLILIAVIAVSQDDV